MMQRLGRFVMGRLGLGPKPVPVTDLHAHILPELDDGPKDLEQSIALLRQAFDGGVRTIVATPHLFLAPIYDYSPEVVRQRFRELTEHLADLSLDPAFAFLGELTLCLGAENHASDGFFRALEDGSVITLNGTRAFLLEFPMGFSIHEMKHAARLALGRALIPVLAHLERYGAIRDDPSLAVEMGRMGCICQVNAESILHRLGPRRTAMALLDSEVPVVIASDAHSTDRRPANLSEASAQLMKIFPAERVRQWVQTRPSMLLGRQLQDATEFR